MTHGSGKNCFNLVLQFKFLVQFSTQFLKIIQFRPFQFKTKLVTKFNYNLYIHVKIIVLNLYTTPKYSNYFIFYKCKKLQMLKCKK